MRTLSMVIALVIAAAASRYTHEVMPVRAAAGVDIVILIVAYLIVSKSIKSYLDE